MKKRLQFLAFCIAALVTPVLIAFNTGDEVSGWLMLALFAIVIILVVIAFLWRAIWMAKHGADPSVLIIVIFAVIAVIVVCIGANSLHMI